MDVLHGDERMTISGTDIVDGDDVGMREAGERLRLAQETRTRLGSNDRLTAKDLECDRAVELGIVGGVDDSSASLAQSAVHDESTHDRPGWQGLVGLVPRP